VAGKLRPLRIVPWVVAAATWIANGIADFGPPRLVSAGCGRFLDAAGIVATVWALLSAYDPRALARDNKRRLDAYGEGWALLHEDAEAERRRARMHLIDRERQVP